MSNYDTVLALVGRVRELLAARVQRAWAMQPEDVEFETLVPKLCDALEQSVVRFNMAHYRAVKLAAWEKEIEEAGDNVGEEFALAVTLLRAAHTQLEHT